MKQVIDKTGNKITGLYRREDNSLVVSDDASYNKSVCEKNRVNEVTELREKLAAMELLIQRLILNSDIK